MEEIQPQPAHLPEPVQTPGPRPGGRQVEPEEAEEPGGVPPLTTSQKLCGAWNWKYATAISPASTNAIGQVNRRL